MRSITLKPLSEYLSDEIKLPLSKSISNRALMINSISKGLVETGLLSDADDTILLKKLLRQIEIGNANILNTGNAGTVMRFLTAYLAGKEGKWVLYGNNRPIEPLVKELIKLGANIDFSMEDGSLKVTIHGTKLKGGEVEFESNLSSQFVSALMIMAPEYEKPLRIHLPAGYSSFPYIEMTAKMMQKAGIKPKTSKTEIWIPNSEYSESKLDADGDWSSAAFWCQLVALGKLKYLKLNNLDRKSIQGDKKLMEFFIDLGISLEKTHQKQIGINYNARNFKKDLGVIDFGDIPDLALPFIITAAAQKQNGVFTGLCNLQHKESNRHKVLCDTLTALGVKHNSSCTRLVIDSGNVNYNAEVIANDDHRVIMSLAPLSLLGIKVKIEKNNWDQVSKSYPGYWSELQKVLDVRF